MAGGNLALAGVSSLRALNTWISVIDANIAGAQKIGYKETRVSLETDLATESTYKTYKGYDITFPSATLLIAKTEILSYEQGTISVSDDLSHLALNGRGYFVLENEKGEKFATRDGEFHFDTQGFLVNAQGLKVLSSGEDYINVPITDQFTLDAQGVSHGLSYGERELMVIDLPQSNHLYYSVYGSTIFEVGGYIPLNFTNDFSTTVNGINPYLVNKSYQNNYIHDVDNSRIVIDTTTDSNALITSKRFDDFNNSVNFIPSTTAVGSGFSSFGFTFGQAEMTNNITNGGFGAGVYQDNTGVFRLGLFEGTAAGSILDDVAIPALDPNREYSLSISAENNVVSVTISEAGVSGGIATVSFDIPQDIYGGSYVSIGTFDRVTLDSITGLTTATGGSVDLTRLSTRESNKNNYFNVLVTGGTATSLGAQVHQNALEQSTASLVDSIPLLGQVQKVFSALSKIISVSNTQTDDLNTLVR